jgi:bifunctional ADP-heptose synthase (sugar kinase/adenylyltransferase)
LIKKFLAQIELRLPATDLVIFSDFNYGCLPQALVEDILQQCKNLGIAVAADSQASSQSGDVSRFKGAQFISATEREARLAMNDFKSGLQNVANNLSAKTDAKMLFVKLGAEGMLAIESGQPPATHSFSAMNSNPLDVAGAGDAMLAMAAMAMAVGATVWECAYLGSIASAIQVSRVGNVPLTSNAFLEAGLR